MAYADGRFVQLVQTEKTARASLLPKPAADPRINRRKFFFFLPHGSVFEYSSEKLQQNKEK